MTAAAGSGCGRRPGAAGDAIVGVVPRTVVEPATLDEAAEVIAAGARDRERIAFVGGGTELGLGAAPESLDLVLRTTALDRVVEHAPLDQIVTVECGVRVAKLQDLLGRHGQMLALDPPWADRATVGGVVATSAFGARRTRYGSLRDLIIGVSFVRADGARARAGGKVVKNVAGFDLPKLLTGSLGTLGFIATATFRLHPRPESSATVVFAGGDAVAARRMVAAAREAQLEPDAVAVVVDGDGDGDDDGDDGDRWDLGVRFAGFERAVRHQRDRLLALGGSLGLPEARRGDGDSDSDGDSDGAPFWARHRAAREAPASFRAKFALLPADPASAEVIACLRRPLAAARAVFYPTLGLGFVAGDAGAGADQPQAIAAAVAQARSLLAGGGGSVVVHDAPAPVRALIDVWDAPASSRTSALPLMRAVKERLDPERRLAPGRFVGGI
jgi:glycolate oxidase FAD binding subunit